jgi:hypothetical protein
LAREQYGSRKGKAAAEQALNKRLVFDILRQERRAAVDVAVDLRSCYDLVVHAIASLSIQRQGMPEQPIVCMFTTLQNMVHTVRTAYGESENSFGSQQLWVVGLESPPQGLGQGNGAGPGIWAVVSTPVFNLLRQQGYGATFELAISGGEVKLVGFAFVDDSDIIQTAASLDETSIELNTKAQAAVDTFVEGMRATGGQVRPDKCWWYQIEFVWTQGGRWKYQQATDCPLDLHVRDGSHQRVPIDQLDPSTAAETLGVWLAPDGNNKTAVKVMRAKSQLWADQVRTGFLTPSEAWLSFNTMVSKQLEYPLVALTLTEANCRHIEAPMLAQVQKSMHMANNFPRDVLDAPHCFQGMNRKSLYMVLGQHHVEILLKHGHLNTTTGELLRTSLERHMVELGLPGSFLDHDFKQFGKLATTSWLRHTWEFIHSKRMKVETSGVKQLEAQRYHDQFLILAFARKGFSGPDLVDLNHCRMFLQATTLSDITSGDGLRLMPLRQIVARTKLNKSRYRWPTTMYPSLRVRRLWALAVSTCFATPDGWDLRQPLGRWLENAAPMEWSFSPSLRTLYRSTKEGFATYANPITRSQRITSTKRFLSQRHIVSDLPVDCVQAVVFTHGSDPAIRVNGAMSKDQAQPPTHIHATRLPTILRDDTATSTWFPQLHHIEDNGHAIARALRKGRAVAVSDGSFKDEQGTAAFVLQNGFQRRNRIEMSNVVPGSKLSQSSYRSELGGLFGIVCATANIVDLHNVARGSITVGCDGSEALWQAISAKGPVSPRASDFDLITAIRTKIAKSPITFIPKWIKGHQDSMPGGRHRRLDNWALLNVRMDTMAKQRMSRELRQPRPRKFTISDEPWKLWLKGQKVSKNLPALLHAHVSEPAIKVYWEKRIPSESWHKTDWTALEHASNNISLGQRVSKTKRVTGMLGVGKFLFHWKAWNSPNCPRCQAGIPEDIEHVLTCPANSTTWATVWNSWLDFFAKHPTYAGVENAIYDHLRAWRTGRPVSRDLSRENTPRGAAIRAQSSLGWYNFLDGFIAREWRQMQHLYYEATKSRRSSLRWTSLLIRQCWVSTQMLMQARTKALEGDESELTEELEHELTTTVRQHFTRGPERMSRKLTRHLFKGSAERLISKGTGMQRQWLSHMIEARERQLRISGASADHTSLRAERELLKRWLQLRSPKRRWKQHEDN